MAKKTWVDKLKQYRHNKQEEYARNILEPPLKVPLHKVLPHPGLVLIMGDRRQGKTGLAHEGARVLHERRGLEAVIHLPQVPEKTRKDIQKLLPPWLRVVRSRAEWPHDCVVIYDEAARSAHARRSQTGNALELDDLISISGQRRQTILFVSHHSRKLDLNVVHEVNRIIWKKPTYAHQLWEREELSDFSAKAFDFFNAIRKGKPWTEATRQRAKRQSLVLDLDLFRFLSCENGLPPWWTDELSCTFRNTNRPY